MANLFESDSKAASDDVDVVALVPARIEKRTVGHENGAGEVVRERHAGDRLGLFARQTTVADDSVDGLPLGE